MQSLRMSVCVASCVRMFLIDLILFQLVCAVLHLILMCFFSVRLVSKYPPRNLIWSVLATVSPFTTSLFIVTFLSCCVLPKWINSVLLQFIFSHTLSIIFLISAMQLVRSKSVSFSFCNPGLKAFMMLWSSVNPFRLIFSGHESFSTLLYETNMKAPVQLPWGALKVRSFSVEYLSFTWTLNDHGLKYVSNQ